MILCAEALRKKTYKPQKNKMILEFCSKCKKDVTPSETSKTYRSYKSKRVASYEWVCPLYHKRTKIDY